MISCILPKNTQKNTLIEIIEAAGTDNLTGNEEVLAVQTPVMLCSMTTFAVSGLVIGFLLGCCCCYRSTFKKKTVILGGTGSDVKNGTPPPAYTGHMTCKGFKNI